VQGLPCSARQMAVLKMRTVCALAVPCLSLLLTLSARRVEAQSPGDAGAAGAEGRPPERVGGGADASVQPEPSSAATPAGAGSDQPGAAPFGSSAVGEPPPPVEPPAAAPAAALPATAAETATAVETATALETAPAVDVTVRGASRADRLRQSAEAVTVIDTERAKRASADLGEVLSREVGLSVRRTGGLGNASEFVLDGLGGDRVRFYLDGVPLDFAGFGLGVANVPANLVEHVEVYRGVVPIRFGADALGGAVNLVPDLSYRGTHGAASYSVGSFGTHRATACGRHLFKKSGLFVRAHGFFDDADNDYRMQADVVGMDGRPRTVRVRRFHDGYRAWGAGGTIGFVQRPWAKRLLLELYTTDSNKELQHGLSYAVAQANPWGEVERSERTRGTTLRFEKSDRRWSALTASFLAGYAHRALGFRDASTKVYNWTGTPTRDRAAGEQLPTGERGAAVTDQHLGEHRALARVDLGHRLAEAHALRFNASFQYTRRAGEERLLFNPADGDRLRYPGRVAATVLGLEYELRAIDERLENVLFVKDYIYHASGWSEEQKKFAERVRDTHTQGAGDALRFRIGEGLWIKASYEYATRLPRIDEVLGLPGLVDGNARLSPERSHNGNLGLTLERKEEPSGGYRAVLYGFVRRTKDEITFLTKADGAPRYENFGEARYLGTEASAGWTSPGRWVELDGNVTYVDARLVDGQGAYATFTGDRLRNQPWLFANGSARAQMERLFAGTDELSLTWLTRYVHPFYYGWSSGGTNKAEVPSQLQHTILLTYLIRKAADISASAEVQNLADARLYDYLGIPKPGRAFFGKVTIGY